MSYKKSCPKTLANNLYQRLKHEKDVYRLKKIECIYYRMQFGFSPEQIANMLGYTVQTVRNIHSRFLKEGEAMFFQKDKKKGGRYHAYLAVEEEKVFLSEFRKKVASGQSVSVNDIYQAYCKRVGRKVCKSTVYRLLKRHQWT